MRRALFPLGFAALAAGLTACGPSPEANSPPRPSDTRPTPPPKAQVAAATFDLSPVKEPPDILGSARWKNPMATLGSLAGCGGVDPRFVEGNGKLLADLVLRGVLGEEIDTSQLAGVIALDAPIDAIAAIDPSPKRRDAFGAVAIGLASLERARGAVEGAAVEVAPGMWRVGSKDNTDATCVIAAAAGSAPARLICAERDRDVMALGPYLARNVPTLTTPGGDLHGELRFSPIVARFGDEMRLGLQGLPLLLAGQASIDEPKFDRALGDAANGIQDELTALLGDLDSVSFDLGVDASTCIKATGGLALKGRASWLAGTISDRVERAGPPPAIFWRAPKDSSAAFYARGSDPARFAAILQTLRDLAEGAMAKGNVGKSLDRKAVVDLLAMPFGKDSNTVQATGFFDEPAPTTKPGAKGAKAAEPTPQQTMNTLMNDVVGWSLFGVDEGPEQLSKTLKRFVDAYNKHVGLAVAREKAEARAKDPKGRAKWELSDKERQEREKKLPPKSLLTFLIDEADIDAKNLPTMKLVKAPAALGKDALDIEIKVSDLPSPGMDDMPTLDGAGRPDPKKKAPTVTLTFHILLMADEKNATWLALGQNSDQLVKRLLMVKSGAPDTATLATRPGLDPLKTGRLMGGGFITLAPVTKLATSVVSTVSTLAPGGMPPQVNEIVRLLQSLPHRGETPIFFMSEAAGGSAPRSSLTFSLPKAAMEDIGALVMGGVKLAAQFRP
jgi:hypothetical protein